MSSRGSVMLEGLVAFLPLFVGFLVLCQVTDRYVHELVVGRAAMAAAHAGMLVLSDDGRHYGDRGNQNRGRFAGERRRVVERVVHDVLGAAAGVACTSASSCVTALAVEGSWLVARVDTDYRCLVPRLCFHRRIAAEARVPYPEAAYDYASRE